MAVNPYQNLGWNPVPGAPEELDSLRRKVRAAANSLSRCHYQIDRLVGESEHWRGDAADAFRGAIDGRLKWSMKNAERSLEKAAGWVDRWEADLSSHRDLAKKYDDAAGEQKAEVEKAKKRYEDASQHPDLKLGGKEYPSQEEADGATARLRAAERALNEATTHLNIANAAYDDIIKKARALEDEHRARAAFIAGKLDEADDKLAPKEPGWLGEFGLAHVEALDTFNEFVLDNIGTIGAITGVLGYIPGPAGRVFQGLSMACSGISMAKNFSSEDFRDSLGGDYGNKERTFAYGSVLGDALGLVPGCSALGKAGTSVLTKGEDLMSLGSKASSFTREIVPAFSQVADEAVAGAGKVDYILDGFDVVANIESTLESVGLLPGDGAGHDSSEATKTGAAAGGLPSGLKDIWDTVSELRSVRA